MRIIVIAVLLVSACVNEPAHYADANESWGDDGPPPEPPSDQPGEPTAMPEPAPDPSAANCICDNCTVPNSVQKLCGAAFRNGICNMVNPNSNTSDWIVQQGSYMNCAALNGVQMSGYNYYGTPHSEQMQSH
jgi:hypothetical protein